MLRHRAAEGGARLLLVLARLARQAELLGDALGLPLALRFERGTLLGLFELPDAALLGKMCLFGCAPALFGNAGFLLPTLLFGNARLFRLALGFSFFSPALQVGDACFFGLAFCFGFFRLALQFGNARFLGLPLFFGDTRFFSLALFLGNAALLGLAGDARGLRLALGLGLLGSDAALVLETLLLGDALLLDLALQARRLGAALLLGLALHLDFLLVGFIGEALRFGARRLSLGFDEILLALLIVLAARFGFLVGAAQHLCLVGGALLGGPALCSFGFFFSFGCGARLRCLGVCGALGLFAGLRELLGQRVRCVIVGGCRVGTIHPAHQRHGAHRATAEATHC